MLAIVPIIMVIYFATTLYFIPENYSEKIPNAPSPYFDTSSSDTEITLGESFRIEIISENRGEYGDIHIVSVAFPNLTRIQDQVQIVNYNFSHQPHFVEVGDEIGANYTGGTSTILAKYPSIEAMNRPATTDNHYKIGLKVTPNETGNFSVYIKSVGIPHIDQSSHYPESGKLDAQGEFVQVQTVRVWP